MAKIDTNNEESVNIPDELEKKISDANFYLAKARHESEEIDFHLAESKNEIEKCKKDKKQFEDDISNLNFKIKSKNDDLLKVEKEIEEASTVLNKYNFEIKAVDERFNKISKDIEVLKSDTKKLEFNKKETLNREKESIALREEIVKDKNELNNKIEKVKQALELLK